MGSGRRIYLAGPDVFLSQAVEIGAVKKALCRDFGFTGLYPFDNEVDLASPTASREIYTANVAMIRDADCGIFNLTPFRGPSADVGTVFELGMCVALGKPVFAYSNVATDLIDRLREAGGLSRDPASDVWRDAEGMSVENFGNADNLMIDAALAEQGRRVYRADVPYIERFTALSGFKACLDEARAFFAAAGSRAA